MTDTAYRNSPQMNEYDKAVLDILKASMLDYIHSRIVVCNNVESMCMLFLEMRDITEYSMSKNTDVKSSFLEAYGQHRSVMSGWRKFSKEHNQHGHNSRRGHAQSTAYNNMVNINYDHQNQVTHGQRVQNTHGQRVQNTHGQPQGVQNTYGQNTYGQPQQATRLLGNQRVKQVTVNANSPTRSPRSPRSPKFAVVGGGSSNHYNGLHTLKGGGGTRSHSALRKVLSSLINKHGSNVPLIAKDEDVVGSMFEAFTTFGSEILSGITDVLPAWPLIASLKDEWTTIRATTTGSTHRRNSLIRLSMRIMMAGGLMACNLTSPIHGGIPCIPLSVTTTIANKLLNIHMERSRESFGYGNVQIAKQLKKGVVLNTMGDDGNAMVQLLDDVIPSTYTSPCDATVEERRKYIILTLSHVIDVTIRELLIILPANSNLSKILEDNPSVTTDKRTKTIADLKLEIWNTLSFNPESTEPDTINFILKLEKGSCGEGGHCITVRRDVLPSEIESAFDWIEIIIQAFDGSEKSFTWGSIEDYIEMLIALKETYISLANEHLSDNPTTHNDKNQSRLGTTHASPTQRRPDKKMGFGFFGRKSSRNNSSQKGGKIQKIKKRSKISKVVRK